MFEASTIAASVLGGLSVLLLTLTILPVLHRRKVMLRRLQAVVESADPDREAAAEQPQPRRSAWSLSTGPGSPWMLRNAARLLPFALVGAVVLLLTHQFLLTFAAELQVCMFVSLWGQRADAGRSAQLDAQMLPTILRMTAAIRAGASLTQALEVAAEDAPSPTREALKAALNEVGLGASLDTALRRMADRFGTQEYMILSLVLTVQRRVGGNLPLVLDRIGDAVRQRIEFRREVAVLTSQQRLSTWILALLPFLVGLAFMLADRSFMMPLFTTTPGYVIVLVAASLQLVGTFALRWTGRVSL
jgi:tight adherence protein B